MGHKFSHLQKRDRYKIEALLNTGHKPQEIADEIHVHVSTIYREIKRARMVQLTTDLEEVDKYNPDEAEKRYRENLSAKGPALKIGKDFELVEYLEAKMLDKDNPRSPAAALADIKLEGRTFKTSICVSTLYSYIEKGVFLTLTNADLPEKPKRKRKYRKVREAKSAAAGDSIDRRPPGSRRPKHVRALGGRHRLQQKRRVKSPACADRAIDPPGNYHADKGQDRGKRD